MTDEQKLQKAQQVYATIRAALDQRGWNYGVNDERLSVQVGVQGDDLPMEIRITADVRRQMLVLISPLPLVVKEDKRLDTAVAVAVANQTAVDGGFDFDLNNGRLYFRMNDTFIDCEPSVEVINHMVSCTCALVDHYNDRFMMLSSGLITLEKFIEMAQGR